jgi:hypothetical protein
MLTSNRDVIADILEGLAYVPYGPFPDVRGSVPLFRGADTLRWCDEFEGVGECEEAGESAALAEDFGSRIDVAQALLMRWVRDGMRKPTQFRDALTEALGA